MPISFAVDSHGLLKRWQVRFQEDPFTFNQVTSPGDGAPFPDGHLTVYVQEDRERLAQAIHNAFNIMAFWLGYFPKPMWVEDEVIDFSSNDYWYDQRLRLDKAWLDDFGKRRQIPLTVSSVSKGKKTGATYQDYPKQYRNAGNMEVSPDDLATISITLDKDMTVDELADLHLFFNPAATVSGDRVFFSHFQDYDPRLEIIPLGAAQGTDWGMGDDLDLAVDIADIVNPKLWQRPYAGQDRYMYSPFDKEDDPISYFAEAGDANKFLACRDEMDKESAVTLLSLPSSGDSAAPVETPGEAIIENKESSEFRVRVKAGHSPPSDPYAVRVSYRSGLPLQHGQMDPELELALFRLVNANTVFRDLHLNNRPGKTFPRDWEEMFEDTDAFAYMTLPIAALGTKRGHYEAFTVIQRRADPNKGNVK